MSRRGRALLLACCALAAGFGFRSGRAAAQGSGVTDAGTVSFSFSDPQLHPGHYSLVVHGDGTGSYHVDADGDQPADDRPITLEAPLREQVFALAHATHGFQGPCDAGRKHLAFTGDKTFRYSGGDGAGQCTFNYARDAKLQTAASDMIAVAYTLEEGRKLQLLLAHDPLGLDAELQTLADGVADGGAQQIQNIRDTLQAIAGDDALLLRARTRAQGLLATK